MIPDPRDSAPRFRHLKPREDAREARPRNRPYPRTVPAAVLWFRRDLRLGDHPALLAALDSAGSGGEVLPVFVFDERLWGPSGGPRRRFLLDCLADLREQTGGALVLRSSHPAQVIPALVAELGATSVHVSADAGPYVPR